MFRYVTKDHKGRTNKGRHDIAIGDTVQSHYRARWIGTVLDLDPNTGLATVRQTIDRHRIPIRKPKTVEYHCSWFRKIDAITESQT